jgi:large subunit ribosomal protein L10
MKHLLTPYFSEVMALTKNQKSAQVIEVRDLLKRAKSLVFMHYCGLSVPQVDDLRRRMLEKDAKMKVAKKTLFTIAAKEEGYPEVPDEALDGPVAFVCSFTDEMSGAKVAYEFGKTHDVVKLIGGVMNGRVLSKAEAIDLARMLSHEEMLATFAALLRAPMSNFASICRSPLMSFAIGLKELAEKKEKEVPVAEADPSSDSSDSSS